MKASAARRNSMRTGLRFELRSRRQTRSEQLRPIGGAVGRRHSVPSGGPMPRARVPYPPYCYGLDVHPCCVVDIGGRHAAH